MRENLATFYSAIEQGWKSGLPEFVRAEVSRYLNCSVLQREPWAPRLFYAYAEALLARIAACPVWWPSPALVAGSAPRAWVGA